MAIDNTQSTFAKMEFPLAMQRQNAFALDPSEVWTSLEAAKEYAKTDPTAYVGQKIAVVIDGVATQYQILNTAGDLAPIGGVSENDIATDAEVQEMLEEVFSAE